MELYLIEAYYYIMETKMDRNQKTGQLAAIFESCSIELS